MKDFLFRYMPPRQRDIDWGLHVSGAGNAVVPAGESYPPVGHPELYDFSWMRGRTLPEYSIIWISKGEGVFESSVTGEQPVSEGTAMLLFPGIWHRYRPSTSSGWTEWWVSFSGEIIDRLITKRFFSPLEPLLHPQDPRSLLTIFESTVAQLDDISSEKGHVLAAYVLEMLAILSQRFSPDRSALKLRKDPPIPAVSDRHVSEALRIIWTESHAELSVCRLARRLGLSARSLERRFHRCLNRTIRDVIRECRVARAERLLAETDLPIASVVTAAGFCSYDGMRRAIMKSNGRSPSRLREMLQHRRVEGRRSDSRRVARTSKHRKTLSPPTLVPGKSVHKREATR